MAGLREALALQQAGDTEAATGLYREILARDGDSVPVLANLASLIRADAPAEAERLLQRAIALAPQSGPLRRNLGNLLRDAGRAEAAAEAYAVALALDPGDDVLAEDLGKVLLFLGRFAEAWPLMERRADKARAHANALSFPEWRGEPLAGKRLFIWPEQGFGDQILAMRFLAQLDCEVTLACRPELARLFAQLPAKVVTIGETVQVPPHDYWTLPLSLPARLGITEATLPTASYFTGTARKGPRVGVAWQGNAQPDPGRSLPRALGERLLALEGAISLHPQDTGARDFQDTADVIAGLDLVISVDTSVAHLAGAMGKATSVLVQARVPEWRWRVGRGGQSVWYPSASVIRQSEHQGWTSAVSRAASEWNPHRL